MNRGVLDIDDTEAQPLLQRLRVFFAGLSAFEAARCLVVVAALLMVLISLEPFPDLRGAGLPGAVSGRFALTYIIFAALAGTAVLLALAQDGPSLRTLVTPLHLCFLGWMLINIVFSENRGLSMQRFVLTMSVTALAVLLPLLPPNQKSFNRCMGGAALALLAVCYLGIELVPQLSIHSAADFGEPQLAGDWRGSFGHKNVASPVMSCLVYLGIYLTTVGSFVMGPIITVFAGMFLIFTGGKTSTVLCLVIFVLASLVYATRSLWLKRIICLAPLIVMNLLTIGSVASPNLAAITRALPVDPTFTGRSDIWDFALTAVAEKPIIGHGYAAFWDDVRDRDTASGAEWSVTAAHSHNSYLDLAVTIGLPGLALCVFIFVFAPLRNFQAIQEGSHSGALARLFLTIWLFGLYFGTTETFLLDRQNPTWFLFVIAVAGLHFLARFQCVEEPTG